MKKVIFLFNVIVVLSFTAQAQEKIKMYFNNEELIKIIEMYSKASGQKFVIDPTVRGKVSIYLQEAVTTEEAFNHLSSALALNGFAISKQGDTMIISNARSIQRNLIEVTTDKPTLKPERMMTYIYTVKNFPADYINRELRMLTSSYGEMSVNSNTNQIVFTDWSANLNRVADLLVELDKPVDASTKKLVEAGQKNREMHGRLKSKEMKPEPKEKTN